MAEKFTRWDASDNLKTEEDITAYFEACLDDDPGDGSGKIDFDIAKIWYSKALENGVDKARDRLSSIDELKSKNQSQENAVVRQSTHENTENGTNSTRTNVASSVGNTLQPIVAGIGKAVGTIIEVAVVIAVFALVGYGSYSSARFSIPIQSNQLMSYPAAKVSKQSMNNNHLNDAAYGISQQLSTQKTYNGFSGKEYKYDLSKPVDKIQYRTDIKAQMADSLDADPRKDLDQYMGQTGGGGKK